MWFPWTRFRAATLSSSGFLFCTHNFVVVQALLGPDFKNPAQVLPLGDNCIEDGAEILFVGTEC